LYNKLAEFVVTKDLGFENATYMQKQLIKLGFVNLKLMRYMIMEVDNQPELITKSKPICLLTFVCALSQSDYKADKWNDIEQLILQSDLFTNKRIRATLPWAKLSNELLSLGTECPLIWSQIFNDEFLKLNLPQFKNHHLMILLELWQNIKVLTDYNISSDSKYLDAAKKLVFSQNNFPLKPYIESAFGGSSFVYSKVRTELGQLFDHVIPFDKETLEPIMISDGRNYDVSYEDITSDHVTKKYVAVVLFPEHFYCINFPILRGVHRLKLRTFEKIGISVVSINHLQWSNLSDEEKMLYIKREVNLMLSDRSS